MTSYLPPLRVPEICMPFLLMPELVVSCTPQGKEGTGEVLTVTPCLPLPPPSQDSVGSFVC